MLNFRNWWDMCVSSSIAYLPVRSYLGLNYVIASLLLLVTQWDFLPKRKLLCTNNIGLVWRDIGPWKAILCYVWCWDWCHAFRLTWEMLSWNLGSADSCCHCSMLGMLFAWLPTRPVHNAKFVDMAWLRRRRATVPLTEMLGKGSIQTTERDQCCKFYPSSMHSHGYNLCTTEHVLKEFFSWWSWLLNVSHLFVNNRCRGSSSFLLWRLKKSHPFPGIMLPVEQLLVLNELGTLSVWHFAPEMFILKQFQKV